MIKQVKIKGGRKKESESTYECNYEPERERERESAQSLGGKEGRGERKESSDASVL